MHRLLPFHITGTPQSKTNLITAWMTAGFFNGFYILTLTAPTILFWKYM